MIATDTLATHPGGRPLRFTTKAFIVPHLRLIIAGVGIGGFLSRWLVFLNELVIVRGIDNLDDHTPGALRMLWQRQKQEFSIQDGMTTTVYHFGVSEDTGLIHAYAYRSANNFTSEKLEPYGLRLKPECEIPAEYSLPQDFVTIMNTQRMVQAAKPKEERIYIGGEIEVHHLSKAGFQAFTLHRFSDYETDEKAIFERCQDSHN